MFDKARGLELRTNRPLYKSFVGWSVYVLAEIVSDTYFYHQSFLHLRSTT